MNFRGEDVGKALIPGMNNTSLTFMSAVISFIWQQ